MLKANLLFVLFIKKKPTFRHWTQYKKHSPLPRESETQPFVPFCILI